MTRSRHANRAGNYGSSSVRKNENIVTSSQAYDNYYGKVSVQKDIKNTPITNGGFVYSMPTYNKESGLLPKITQASEKKEDEKTRVLYSREKNNRREKEDTYTPVIAQSEIRKVSDNSKTPMS